MRWHRSFVGAVVGLCVLGPAGVGATAPAAGAQEAEPGTAVVVRLVASADPAAQAREAAADGGRVAEVYDAVFPGFAATVPADGLAALAADPAVLSVEVDGTVRASDVQSPAPWGLDRADQRARPLDGSYTSPVAGQGVTAYVLDTGVFAGHAELAGRVRAGHGVVADGRGTDDCTGHGTHVAGTVAGTTWGLAKAATVVPVRVLGCDGSGPYSDLLAGIDWVIADHAEGEPAVANLSLGGPPSRSLDAAVAALVADGVTVVAAGGNDGTDACATSPGRAPAALTVGATDRDDRVPAFSNDGPCLDLFAPGVGITSAWPGSSTASAVLSGTSMATPHVAGAAAVLLAQDFTLSPAQVATRLVEGASTGVVRDAAAGSPDRLLRLVVLPRGGSDGVDVFYPLRLRR